MQFNVMNTKRPKFPMIVKRGSCAVKIYRDQKPQGTYYRVAYHLGGKRHRLNFRDLETATTEAEAKASQLSRGDVDAVQLSGRDRLIYGRALDAVNVRYGRGALRPGAAVSKPRWGMRQSNVSPRYTTHIEEILRVKA